MKTLKEELYKWLAWKLPKHLVMWCFIRVVANATTNDYGDTVVSELDCIEALKRWEF